MKQRVLLSIIFLLSSPIVDKPRGYFGLLGVNYTFGKLGGGPPTD